MKKYKVQGYFEREYIQEAEIEANDQEEAEAIYSQMFYDQELKMVNEDNQSMELITKEI